MHRLGLRVTSVLFKEGLGFVIDLNLISTSFTSSKVAADLISGDDIVIIATDPLVKLHEHYPGRLVALGLSEPVGSEVESTIIVHIESLEDLPVGLFRNGRHVSELRVRFSHELIRGSPSEVLIVNVISLSLPHQADGIDHPLFKLISVHIGVPNELLAVICGALDVWVDTVDIVVVASSHLFSDLLLTDSLHFEVLGSEGLEGPSINLVVRISSLDIAIVIPVVLVIHCIEELPVGLLIIRILHVSQVIVSGQYVEGPSSLHILLFGDDSVAIEVSVDKVRDCTLVGVICLTNEVWVNLVVQGESEVKLSPVTPIEVEEVVGVELDSGALAVAVIRCLGLVARLGACYDGGDGHHCEFCCSCWHFLVFV